MPFGYSYLEMFNLREKAKFLREHMNSLETRFFTTFYIMTQFVLLFVIISILFLREFLYSSFALLFFHSILTQNFRRAMYIKYGYNKKPSKLKTFFWNFILVVGFLISISFLFGFSPLQYLKSLVT